MLNTITKQRSASIAGVVLLLAAAMLYLFTLDNGLRPDELTGGDLITHQYAQVEARPSNAPGYPLYTMGGWLWFRVAGALLGWRLNPIQILSAYSMLWGLASLAILYVILLKIGDGRWPMAFLLTAFYATTFFFWYYSVTTEQYTSAVFQTLLIIWLAFRWDESPQDSTLLWLAFISGTMLANMVTTLFILPPLLWFVFFKRFKTGTVFFDTLKRPFFVLKATGVGLLPFLSYAYIYIRGAQHPEWRGAGQWASTWEWFIQFLTIQQGRDELAPGLTLQTIFTDEFPTLMAHELTWPIFVGGLIGLACLGKRRAIFLYSTLVIYFIFSWGYRFGNWFQVIIPAYPIFIIGVAAGLMRMSEWGRANQQIGESANGRMGKDHDALRPTQHATRNTQQTPLFVQVAIIALLATLLIFRFTTNITRANQRNLAADTGLDPGWAILADDPASPAIVFSDFEERVALEYLQAVWPVEPTIKAVAVTATETAPSDDATRYISYISRRAALVEPKFLQTDNIHPWAAGEQLIQLQSEPTLALPPTATPLSVNFDDALQLAGWEQVGTASNLLPDNVDPPRANWQLALYWQSSTILKTDYTVSVRPLVADQLIMHQGEAVIQDHQPVWNVYPTSRWTPGEVVRDLYALTLPADVTPNAVQIVVYETTATGFVNLKEYRIELGADRAE